MPDDLESWVKKSQSCQWLSLKAQGAQKSGNWQRWDLSFKRERGDENGGRKSQGIKNPSISIPANILVQINYT